jgi:hypothetical protein
VCHFTPTDPAIDFGLKIHPICLPVNSNTDPNKWRDQDVDILGFSTLDKGESSNRGDRLKIATMTVYNQTTCNSKLNIALEEVKKCIKENGESNCNNAELVYQVKNAIPEGYTQSVFCAGNSVDGDATCKGDSGKYVLC